MSVRYKIECVDVSFQSVHNLCNVQVNESS